MSGRGKKPNPRQTLVKAGGSAAVATAIPGNPTRSRRRRAGHRVPPWIRSLHDPCSVRDVRIPDGQMFPTATGSLRLVRSISAPSATAKTVVGFCPNDLVIRPESVTNAVNAYTYAVDALNDGSQFQLIDSSQNHWPFGYGQATGAPANAIISLMKSARVVSACAKLVYSGSALVNGGMVTGFVLPSGQLAGRAGAMKDPDLHDLDFVQHATPASIRNLPFNVTGPLRDGMEVFKFPTSREELKFFEAEHPVTGAGGLFTNLMTSGSMGFLIDWSDAGQSVFIEYVVNFEYNPYTFASANTRSVGFEPSTITRVGEMANNVFNLIRPLVPYIRPLVQYAGQRLASQGSSTVTIEDA